MAIHDRTNVTVKLVFVNIRDSGLPSKDLAWRSMRYAVKGLNLRPGPYKDPALTTELTAHTVDSLHPHIRHDIERKHSNLMRALSTSPEFLLP